VRRGRGSVEGSRVVRVRGQEDNVPGEEVALELSWKPNNFCGWFGRGYDVGCA